MDTSGLYLFIESGSFGSGNATSIQGGAIFQVQGIGYPTYDDTGLSIEHNGVAQRIGGQVYAGSNIPVTNNLRYYNGQKYQIPLLSSFGIVV